MSGKQGFAGDEGSEAIVKEILTGNTDPGANSLIKSDADDIAYLMALFAGTGIIITRDGTTGKLIIINSAPVHYQAIARITSGPTVSIGVSGDVTQKMVMDAAYGNGAADIRLESGSAPKSRFVVPTGGDGTYMFVPFLNINLGTVANFDRGALFLKKNGSTDYGVCNHDISVEDWLLTGRVILDLVAGDYIEWYFEGITNGGGSCNVNIRGGNATGGNWMASNLYIEKIA